MTVFTIGFTRKPAEVFFNHLQTSGAARLIDVRLNNVSQLAGFAKKDDLRYFTKALCGIDYLHSLELAPTAEILDPYKKQKNGDWDSYQLQFLDLIKQRRIEESIPRELIDGACLLCSEEKPHHCHRRLVAEYLQSHWGDLRIEHIP